MSALAEEIARNLDAMPGLGAVVLDERAMGILTVHSGMRFSHGYHVAAFEELVPAQEEVAFHIADRIRRNYVKVLRDAAEALEDYEPMGL